MVKVLMMSGKMATLGLLKIEVILNIVFDVKMSAYHGYHVTQFLL